MSAKTMKCLVSLVGLLAAIGVYFDAAKLGRLNAGVGLLVAAAYAAACAFPEIAQYESLSVDVLLRAKRELILGYECLILGLANVLAGPDVPFSIVVTAAVVLALAQSLILWLVFKCPRIVRTSEGPASVRRLSVRGIIVAFAYLSLFMLGGAIYVSRAGSSLGRPIPVPLQWPGLVLLFGTFSCLGLGFACDHSRGSLPFYATVGFLAAASLWMELIGRRNWYFLSLSLIALVALASGWPGPRSRHLSSPTPEGARETGR